VCFLPPFNFLSMDNLMICLQMYKMATENKKFGFIFVELCVVDGKFCVYFYPLSNTIRVITIDSF
jgi:hypothetical protein